MFQHNLRLIVRNFSRFKSTFFINLAGLSTGLACALLIFLWVNDELQFDKFHEKGSQLYRVMALHKHTDVTNTQPDVPGLLAPALKADFPEVETAVPTMSGSVNGMEIFTVSADEKYVKAPGRFAGEGFFDIFSYPILDGDKTKMLAGKNSIVISESLAKKLFGSRENIIGKTMKWELYGYTNQVAITGIFQDVPANSSEQFDFVMPFKAFEGELMEPKYVHWHNYYAYCYLTLKKGTDVVALNDKLKGYVDKKAEGSNVSIFLQPYSENYLYGKFESGVQAGGRIEYVRLFSLIALFILAIACINFMNLSTAKSSRRGKEVGVKKAVGASRSSLVGQFLGESMAMAFLSLFVAVILVEVLLPQFNQITGKQLSLHYTAGLLLPVLCITLLTGLLAGSYPALYLSGFNPANVLKGKIKASVGELWVRKGLVVFQFGISLVLIVAVMVIYKQIEFVQNKNLGFNKDNVLSIEMQGKVNEQKETFLNEVRNVPGVVSAAGTGLQIGQGSWTGGIQWEGKAPDGDYIFQEVRTGSDAIETLGIQVLEGRSFSNQYGRDSSGIIFNEAAIKLMGLNDPIGKTVRHYTGEKQIIGVVNDFHDNSLHEAIKPLFFLYMPAEATYALVKIEAGKERETLALLEGFYKKFNPGYPFQFTFLDQDYQALYESERRVSALSRYFAGLAALISCLGLFGLATFAAEQRTKEIGIRKVLGATTAGIVSLLSKDFLKLVLIALAVASPLAYFFMEKWLQAFAYHIDITWWVFGLAGMMAVLVAFLTVGFQSVKAALANPVKSLRSE